MQDFFVQKTEHFLICLEAEITLQYNMPNAKDLPMFHENNIEYPVYMTAKVSLLALAIFITIPYNQDCFQKDHNL
jgi:hypothetical protein